MTVPPWLADAAAMPVAFAQVREDPRVDLAVLDLLGDRRDLSGIMIASGGCTAAALVAAKRFGRLDLVDINPAQLALARLKLHLLEHATPQRRLEACGHAPQDNRATFLADAFAELGLPPNVLGPPQAVAAIGPDHSGRYELLFAQLQRVMGGRWAGPLSNGGVDPDPLDTDAAFDDVMTLANLVALFGEKATQNRVEPFARHFARRTRVALSTLPTGDNPFLWQLLVGRFPPGAAYDWFNAPPPARSPDLHFIQSTMTDALAASDAGFDFVHLSNILDWLSEAEASETLAVARRALRPGGVTVIRQLNSSLDLAALGDGFDWLDTTALHARDRSFFYRRLYVGRRR
jgi:S-adenosylmethionine-diacylglycerol 3-amino-3-carboxypropyl transferase